VRKRRRPSNVPPRGAGILAGQRSRSVPFEFVIDALAALAPMTRPMFGCLAVYVEDKIVLILRDRHDHPADNGVWLATRAEHHGTLQHEFPRMRSIRLLGHAVTHWQVLPVDDPQFEESARRACGLILARDPRIGKVPKRRRLSKSTASASRGRLKRARGS